MIEKDGVELAREGAAVAIRTSEYVAGPVHLSEAELAALGLRMSGRPELPPRFIPVEPDAPIGFDAMRQRGPTLTVGDYLLVAVQGGVDLFVWAYDAMPALVPTALLQELALNEQ